MKNNLDQIIKIKSLIESTENLELIKTIYYLLFGKQLIFFYRENS